MFFRKSILAVLLLAAPLAAQDYLRDRGPGLPTSLFGTFIEKGQWIVYPFYEYISASQDEYHPSELGFIGEEDYLGESTEHEFGLFVAYGFTDRLALEIEPIFYRSKTLDKAPDDPSAMPPRLEESGFGEVEFNLRYRWREETASRPELFGFLEVVPPTQRSKVLIGVPDWEGSIGFGAIKGFAWGTLASRTSLSYEAEEAELTLGESAIEFIRRVSPALRLVSALEIEDDEVSLIGEAQWFVRDNVIIKLNTGLGITPKAADFAPEVGVLFSF